MPTQNDLTVHMYKNNKLSTNIQNNQNTMSGNEKKHNSDLMQLISNLSSQSNESSNIVLQAISQGITTGLSQGIASGNISVSFQDVIALASVFKPNNEVPLRIIDRMVPTKYDDLSPSTIQESTTSITTRNEKGAAKVLANPNSLEVNPDSLGLPSSVHVFDVTNEKIPAYECTVTHRVSENADDTNAVSSISSSTMSSGCSNTTFSLDIPSSRKRTINCVTEDEGDNQVNSRPRFEEVEVENVIGSIEGLIDYVSSSNECNVTEAVSTERDHILKNNGKVPPFRLKYHLLKFSVVSNRFYRFNELHTRAH